MKVDSSYIMYNSTQGTLEFRLSAKIAEDENWFLASCPELQMTDQGKTVKEAIRNLTEMVEISLIEAIETGHIESMLKALGFNRSKVPVPTVSIYEMSGAEYQNLVPIYLVSHIPSSSFTRVEYTSSEA
jgi:predicted RNase H-like HicB family nuclease